MTISQVAELVKWGSVCGPWEYKRLESYMTPLTDLPSNENQLVAQHPPGEYLVSIHIAPGIWKVEGTQTCEWAVFDITSKSFQDGQGVTGKFTLSEDAFWVRIGKDCYGASFLHE